MWNRQRARAVAPRLFDLFNALTMLGLLWLALLNCLALIVSERRPIACQDDWCNILLKEAPPPAPPVAGPHSRAGY